MGGRVTRARVTKGWKALTAEFNAKLIKSQLASSQEEAPRPTLRFSFVSLRERHIVPHVFSLPFSKICHFVV